MDKIFEATLFNRNKLLTILESCSDEQLNFVPKNFNNSIIWNIGHVLVTEQLLVYRLSGLELKIEESYVNMLRKGTSPLQDFTSSQIQYIKENLIRTVEITRKDYQSNLFRSYQSYPTSTGIVLNNVDEALQFNAFHEGIHLGVVLSLIKLTQKI
ncbi:DinB family protein [Namhaeicola litoreus]|uniref:DinB family protein n=1 Tax=Namhaeicola litoreus TaxID=1052145 RepID=A0ABW3Y2F5_9FLAO